MDTGSYIAFGLALASALAFVAYHHPDVYQRYMWKWFPWIFLSLFANFGWFLTHVVISLRLSALDSKGSGLSKEQTKHLFDLIYEWGTPSPLIITWVVLSLLAVGLTQLPSIGIRKTSSRRSDILSGRVDLPVKGR